MLYDLWRPYAHISYERIEWDNVAGKLNNALDSMD